MANCNSDYATQTTRRGRRLSICLGIQLNMNLLTVWWCNDDDGLIRQGNDSEQSTFLGIPRDHSRSTPEVIDVNLDYIG